MNSIVLHIIIYLPTKLLLVYLAYIFAKEKNKDNLRLLGVVFILLAFVSILSYFSKVKEVERKQSEIELGHHEYDHPLLRTPNKRWWRSLRLAHASLYICAGIYAIRGREMVWFPVFLDIILGVTTFFWHHYVSEYLDS